MNLSPPHPFFTQPAEACIGLEASMFGWSFKARIWCSWKGQGHVGQWATHWNEVESLRGETAGPRYKHQHHRFVQGSTRAPLSTTTCPTGSVAPSTHQLASAPSTPQRPLHCWATYGQEAGLNEPARIHLFICPSSLPSLLHSTSIYAVPTLYQALCKPLQMQQ